MNKKNKITTYLCYITLSVFAISLTSISPLLPAISKTFSLTKAKAGSIFTAQAFGFFIFILIGGFLADKYGKKQIINYSLFGFAISLLLFAISKTYYSLLLTIMFVGAFGGVLESISTALVFDLNKIKRSYYVNLSQVFFGFGAIIGPFLAGFILSREIEWRVYYYVLIIIVFVLALIFTLYKTPPTPKVISVTMKDLSGIFKNKKFILICFCMIFYTGSEIGGWGWLSTLVKENMHFSIEKSGLAVSVFWIAMTTSRILIGRLTLIYKLRSIIIILAALSSIVTLLAVFTSSEILVWFVIVALGLTYSSQFSLIVDYGTQNSSLSTGITVSLLIGSGAVGSMLVPYFMGVAGDHISLSYAMIIPTVLLMLVAIIFIGFGIRQNKSLK